MLVFNYCSSFERFVMPMKMITFCQLPDINQGGGAQFECLEVIKTDIVKCPFLLLLRGDDFFIVKFPRGMPQPYSALRVQRLDDSHVLIVVFQYLALNSKVFEYRGKKIDWYNGLHFSLNEDETKPIRLISVDGTKYPPPRTKKK